VSIIDKYIILGIDTYKTKKKGYMLSINIEIKYITNLFCRATTQRQ